MQSFNQINFGKAAELIWPARRTFEISIGSLVIETGFVHAFNSDAFCGAPLGFWRIGNRATKREIGTLYCSGSRWLFGGLLRSPWANLNLRLKLCSFRKPL